MQPNEQSNIDLSGVQTLADFIYRQFPPTAPVEVQNILPKPYYFKYCTNEDIQSPDQFSRKVVKREYEEKTVQPGESITLLGAAAYIFVDGVARAYVQQKLGDKYVGDIEKLAQAAKLAIIGEINLNNRTATAPEVPQLNQAPAGHNPNAIQDDSGQIPPQTPPAGDESEPFADDDEDGDSNTTQDQYHVMGADKKAGTPERYFKNGVEISEAEYKEATNATAGTASK